MPCWFNRVNLKVSMLLFAFNITCWIWTSDEFWSRISTFFCITPFSRATMALLGLFMFVMVVAIVLIVLAMKLMVIYARGYTGLIK